VNEELLEKVAREMANEIGDDGDNWLIYSPEARAAIRVVVEECAKVAEAQGNEQALYAWNKACDECASEIRKLAQDNNGEVA
jgi:hypothetical protein